MNNMHNQHPQHPGNGIFGGLTSEALRKVEASAPPCPTLKLEAFIMTPSRERVPVSESLVAYDVKNDCIVKMLASFIPPYEGAQHEGKKFLLNREFEPIALTSYGKPPADGKKRWNPWILLAFLNTGALPWTNQAAEFRMLRVYRSDIRVRDTARFEIFSFDIPKTGEVDRRSLRIEQLHNSAPKVVLPKMFKPMYAWHNRILTQLSHFGGVPMLPHLGIKLALEQQVREGHMPARVADDITRDESAAEEFEGREFFIPANPLMPDYRAEEEAPLDPRAIEDEEERIKAEAKVEMSPVMPGVMPIGQFDERGHLQPGSFMETGMQGFVDRMNAEVEQEASAEENEKSPTYPEPAPPAVESPIAELFQQAEHKGEDEGTVELVEEKVAA